MKYFDGYIHGHIVYICIYIYISNCRIGDYIYIHKVVYIKYNTYNTNKAWNCGCVWKWYLYMFFIYFFILTSITPVYGQVNVNIMIILGDEHS